MSNMVANCQWTRPKMIGRALNNYSAHSTLTKSKGQLIPQLTHINRFLSGSPVWLTTNTTSCCHCA